MRAKNENRGIVGRDFPFAYKKYKFFKYLTDNIYSKILRMTLAQKNKGKEKIKIFLEKDTIRWKNDILNIQEIINNAGA